MGRILLAGERRLLLKTAVARRARPATFLHGPWRRLHGLKPVQMVEMDGRLTKQFTRHIEDAEAQGPAARAHIGHGSPEPQ